MDMNKDIINLMLAKIEKRLTNIREHHISLNLRRNRNPRDSYTLEELREAMDVLTELKIQIDNIKSV